MERHVCFFLSVIACFSACELTAQITFERVLPPSSPQTTVDFVGVEEGSIAFADVDGDQDQDVLITGKAYSENTARLHINDGQGNFSEVTGTPFEGVYRSSVAFADVDGDQDQDVLITGEDNNEQLTTKLYINDGNGNFSEKADSPFLGVSSGDVAFADVDGDLDQDVLITGWNGSHPTTTLYANDGSGNFSVVSDTPFAEVYLSAVAFADVDGDQDQDVLITGDQDHGLSAILYINDGQGNFSEVGDAPFSEVYRSSIAFADVDGDLDQDVLISGWNGSHPTTALYTNDSEGNFSKATNTHFVGVISGAISFADIDGDLDQDVLITGDKGLFESTTNLYKNDGSGNFSEAEDDSFTEVYRSSIAFADVDSDQDLDVLITGDILFQSVAKLYINDGAGGYGEVDGTPFEPVYLSAVAFADIDGDQDQDVIIGGDDSYGDPSTNLYKNDGNGNFSRVPTPALGGMDKGDIAFADIDGDQDQDVLITKFNGTGYTSLYKNDGQGEYSFVFPIAIENAGVGSVAFADVDGDLDQDVLITGTRSNQPAIAKLYSNDGQGNFSEVASTPFEGVDHSSVAFADVDGDLDLDVLIVGENEAHQRLANLYTNNGQGRFSKAINTSFEGVKIGSIAFADIDGDQDQDVLITGFNNSDEPDTRLYKNDGYGSFSEVANAPFDGVYFSSVAFADVDGDLDQDVLITGTPNKREFKKSSGQTTKLYENDGKGNFTLVEGLPFVDVSRSSIAFADVDGDQDLDVLITGYNDIHQRIAKLYRNTTPIVDRPPAFVSADTIYVPENVSGTVLDINAHDGNTGTNDTGVVYHLEIDGDNDLFKVATNGELMF